MSLYWSLTNVAAAFLLPPLNGLLPAALGLALLRRRPRLGRILVAAGLLLVVLLSTPVVVEALLRPLEERYAPLRPASFSALPADAIVILGSGRDLAAPEFGGADDLKPLALQRVRYAALLARQSGKPVLASGGRPEGEGDSEARIMKRVLARDFGVAVRWTEDESANTRENALASARILLPLGMRRVALVTHAFHMPRAVAAFEAAGFEVLPAPLGYLSTGQPRRATDFLPSYEGMQQGGYALHEAIGLVWYRLRG